MTTTEPLAAVEIAADLWQLPLPIHRHSLSGANAFLVRDADGYVLFDCGADVAECSEALARQLECLGVPFEAIHTLILSHGHGDHAGQAKRVARLSGARIVFHQLETSYIGYPNVRDTDRQQFVDWLRRYGYPEPEIAALMEHAAVGERGNRRDETLDPDQELSGGEVLAIGQYRFEVLWTPGHTPGSICLFERERRILLCGDHILEIVTPNVSLHPLLAENPLPGYLRSLRALASQEIDLVLPGHGPPIVDLEARTVEIARRHQDRREQTLALLTRTPQSAYELSTQIWAKPGRRNWASLHPHLRRNAVGMIAGHLELLAENRAGVICHEEDGTLRFSLDR
ncbi:MAG TPA: MBL fold metallo-hydrolase [Chloroflexota bacterium]|nr:MBL fold metallo-hydrolase [Chloroflexota bacterium]